MFDHYDRIRIINLPWREDRRREMIIELRKQGVEVDGQRVAFFSAVAPSESDGFYSIGANGCYRSHLELLKEAGDESILIIEDDCDFHNDTHIVVVPDCDVFHAGYFSDYTGTHLIGYEPGVARRVAAYLQGLLDDGRRISFDGALVHLREDEPEIRFVFAQPILGFQRPSRTDVGTTDFREKMPLIGTLRALKRRWKRVARRLR